ncbi:general secretion pathway protein D [Oxalobacteraceae bacterium GrIS 2.11]
MMNIRMTPNMLTPLKRNLAQAGSFSLRKIPASLLFCAVTGLVAAPALAQEPSLNESRLTFVGADIESVIKAVGHYTGVTFIVDPRVKGTINLVSEQPVTKAQAFELLTSTLRLQGYAVVTANGFTKVVPESDGKLQAGPTQAVGVKGDQIATQVFRLNYESAGNLVTVLRPLISPNNTINANPGNNSVVITDYADNLKRLAKIIATLDAPSTSGIDVIPLKYGIASDLATLLVRLTEQNNAPADSGKLTIMADSRTNSILLSAPSEARANLVKTLINKLDQPTALPGNVHVVYLRNADAFKLAQTLRAIVGADSSSSSSSNATQNTAQQNQTSFGKGLAGNSGGTGTGSAGLGNALGSSSGSSSSSTNNTLPAGGPAGYIQADTATNTLIITSSETVYRNLRSVIDQLDSRRAQVYIEALIIEVSTSKAAQFGVQWAALSGNSNSELRVGSATSFNTGGASNNLFTLAAEGKAAVPNPGLTLGVFSAKLGLGAIASALQTSGNANVLSVPTLTTLDNEEAKILVGQNVPFITGSFASTGSTSGSTVNPFQTIERKDVGVSLKVKPQISEGGSVKLTIYQEVSNVDSTNNTAGIITNIRAIETNVIVDDGQVLVLGGLMSEDSSGTDDQVPLLGDIPFLGNLFKYKVNKHAKSNLLIFLRPTVIRNHDQGNSVSMDRYDYMRAKVLTEKSDQPLLNVPSLTPEKMGMLIPQTILNRESVQNRLEKQDGQPVSEPTSPVSAPDTTVTPSQVNK